MSKPPLPAQPVPPLPVALGDGPASAPLAGGLAEFRAACEQYLELVWRFAAYCGVPAEALDHVVYKVFGVIHGRLISLEHPEELRVSVAGITRNVVRGYLRQLGDHSTLDSPHAEAGLSPIDFGPGDLERRSAAELCDLIFSKMTETEREVFILCEVEGMSLSDTAEALHIGESTLGIRLNDARKIFNTCAAELRAHQFWTTRQTRPDE
jgi:DNA-directed RNA polymerase specialized sigma24 family protein